MTEFLRKILNSKAETEKQKFSSEEARNLLFYMIGIMAYKFALETYLGTHNNIYISNRYINSRGRKVARRRRTERNGDCILLELVGHCYESRIDAFLWEYYIVDNYYNNKYPIFIFTCLVTEELWPPVIPVSSTSTLSPD